MQFSVIVPVHNAAQTILRCVASVSEQSFSDYELLLIHNGSTDDSLALCRNVAEKDDRIRVFDIGACGGPSRPRNVGLEHARGEFVVFLDADDYLEKNALEQLVPLTEKYDVAFYGFQRENESGAVLETVIPQQVEGELEEVLLALSRQDCFGYTCCKAFRRTLIGEHRFDECLNLFEDEQFALQVLGKDARIAILPQAVYHYVVGNEESLTKRVHKDMAKKKDVLYRCWKAVLGERHCADADELSAKYIRYCKFYYYENHLPTGQLVRDLRETAFYHDCLAMGNPFAEKVRRGKLAVTLDRCSWWVKRYAAKILRKR